MAIDSRAQKDGLNNGVDFYQEGKYNECVSELKSWLETNKKDYTSWLYLGACHMKLGQEEDAKKAFRKVPSQHDQKEFLAARLQTYVKITKRPRATYTKLARDNHVTGTVDLIVELLAREKLGLYS
ncbi:MAG: tetratricopeptide repeat protein [Pyrinomonadaceae bacterium]